MDGTSATPSVDGADDLGLHPQGGHLAVSVGFNMMGSLQTVELGALGDSALDFLGQSGHVVLTTTVSDNNLFRA